MGVRCEREVGQRARAVRAELPERTRCSQARLRHLQRATGSLTMAAAGKGREFIATIGDEVSLIIPPAEPSDD